MPQIGLLFAIGSGVFGVVSPVIGYISDRVCGVYILWLTLITCIGSELLQQRPVKSKHTLLEELFSVTLLNNQFDIFFQNKPG